MDVRRLPADQADVLARIVERPDRNGALLRRRHAPPRRGGRRVQTELLSLLERGRADRFGSVRDLLDETVRLEPARRRGGG